MSKKLKIYFWVNGEKYYVLKKINLSMLIEYLGYSNLIFTLEYNQIICDKPHWNDIILSESDKIEIITIVGGG